MTAVCPLAGNRLAAPPTIERAIAPGLYPRSLSGPPRLAAALAALSTRFRTGVFFPRVHSKVTVIPAFEWAERRSFHRSEFSLGSPCWFLQPFFFHSLARNRFPFTYCESVKICTRLTPFHGLCSRIHFRTQ